MSTSDELFRQACARLDGWREEMIEMQKQLVARPALGPENGGQGEWERARYLLEVMSSWGLDDIEQVNAPDQRVPEGNRPNLIVRLGGAKSHPAVCVMAHMDVVPAGPEDDWDTPPFEAVVKEGRIYGRGVEDNQQGLVSALFAMRALKADGVVPPGDVILMLVADEETGNSLGIEHVLKSRPDLVGREDVVVVPDSGNSDGTMLEVAEKSILWAKFTVEGRQVHASMPQLGVNAHRAAASLVCRLDEALHEKYSRRDPVFDPPESTFEPTRRDANVDNVNTIPGREVLYFDCRILPDIDTGEVVETMRGVAAEVATRQGVTIDVAEEMLARAAPATSTSAPVVKLLAEAVARVRGVEPKPMGIGGGTVAALFRHAGIPAVVWSTMDDLAHQPNEYCVIDNMVEDAKVFSHLYLAAR